MQYKITVLLPDGNTGDVSVDATTQDDAHLKAAQHAAALQQSGDPTVPAGTKTTIIEPLALKDSTHTF